MGTITKIDTLGTPVNGTDDREAHSFHWYAARTQMNCEHKVEKRFQHIASDVYLPTQEEIHLWSDRRKRVQRMVIPMILFVKINKDEVKRVHSSRDNLFYGFICEDRAGRTPAAIPDKDIDLLKYMLKVAEKPVSLEQQVFNVGDKIRIMRGAFRGIEGWIQSQKDGTFHLVVDMGSLGYIKTEVNPADCIKLQEN